MLGKINTKQVLLWSGIALVVYYVWYTNQKKKEAELEKKKGQAEPTEIITVAEHVKMVNADGAAEEKTEEQKEQEEKEKKYNDELLEKAKAFLSSKGITSEMLSAAGKGDNFITKYASTLGWQGN
jgi:hypothetical protein